MKKRILPALSKDNCLHNDTSYCRIRNVICVDICDKMSTQKVHNLTAAEALKLRDNILEEQGGKCFICEKHISGDEVCLDHQHTKKIKGTGQIRGVLCRTCNTFIAKVENNATRCKIPQKDVPRLLANMQEYLSREQYAYMHPIEKAKKKVVTKASYNKLIKALAKVGYSKPIPEYKEKQKLTVPLEKLYDIVQLEPEFYK